MDIKYFSLGEWVERDLIKLERVNMDLNIADHYIKQLGPLFFRQHTDYIMGHVPPTYTKCFQQVYTALKERSAPKTKSAPTA